MPRPTAEKLIFDAFILTTNLLSSAIRNLMFLPV